MNRIVLMLQRATLVTPDTAEALRQVELRIAPMLGARLLVRGPRANDFSWEGVRNDPGPTGCPPALSMRATGREVLLRLNMPHLGPESPERRQKEIETLWGFAVPCGFVPWSRYPLVGPADEVFHYLGPWQPLYDSLCGEGRGEDAWPSLCAAAQTDAGKWEGDRQVERFVQAQLHRLGIPCGAVNGVIDTRTLDGLRALGLKGVRLEEAAAQLARIDPPASPKEPRRHGFISFDGPATAVTTGRVSAIRTPQGFAITVDGPGRVILDMGGSP